MIKTIIQVFLLSLITLNVNAQYQGQTFVVDCSKGGFNNNLNTDIVSANSMAEGTRNLNIHNAGRQKRGGTAHVNSTAIAGAAIGVTFEDTDDVVWADTEDVVFQTNTTPRIYGLYQFRLKNGTEFIITATDDGKIRSDYTTTIGTGLTIDQAVHFETFNNLLVICTGNNLPQIWNGTGSISAMANIPTDWVGLFNYPRKMVKHGRGASERLWAVGGAIDPFTVYASGLNLADGTTEPDFSDTEVITISIETSDGFGIINAVEFTDRLLCAGKNRIYIIDDLDIDTANWGYEKSAWEGGTASDRTLIAVSNDVISLTEDGTCYSVTGTQTYGDYKKATLTRPAFMDEWIRSNVDLTAINDFHMVYDPVLRAVYLFVVRKFETEIDTALVYFIDRGPEQGWMIKDNLLHDSGYKCSASALIRKTIGDNKVYTGGFSDGFVWELETTALTDNGNGYASGFKTPRFHLGDPRKTKRFDTGWIVATSTSSNNLLVDVWIDGKIRNQQVVKLTGVGGVYGSAIYGESVYGGTSQLSETSFPIGEDGKRIAVSVHNDNSSEDFFITLLMVDFEVLGTLPD